MPVRSFVNASAVFLSATPALEQAIPPTAVGVHDSAFALLHAAHDVAVIAVTH